MTFNLPNPTMFWILSGFRYVIMAALYGGFTAVIVSVCLIEKKDGPTPPVSPTMQCVMNLTVQSALMQLKSMDGIEYSRTFSLRHPGGIRCSKLLGTNP